MISIRFSDQCSHSFLNSDLYTVNSNCVKQDLKRMLTICFN